MDAHFASILGLFSWSFSLIFQAVMLYSITGRKFYCHNHKKFPEAPEKIFRGSSKNFSVFHEKFWPVSRDGKWAWLRGLIRPSSLNWPSLYFSTFLPSWIYILPFSGWVTLLPLRSYQSSSLTCTLTLPILAGEDFSLTPPINTCGVQPAAI